MNVIFRWDESKNKSNVLKHGISFEEAQTVFYDDLAKLVPDPDSEVEEERFILLGMSSHHKILIVCHCYRESDEHIRIISARKATKHEKREYVESMI